MGLRPGMRWVRDGVFRAPWQVWAFLVGGGYVLLWCIHDSLDDWQVQIVVISFGYVFLWGTSGPVVESVLNWAEEEKEDGSDDGADKSKASDATDGDEATTDGGRVDRAKVRDDDVGAAENGAGNESDEDGAESNKGGEGKDKNGEVTQADRDVGTIVGKSENILIPTFILVEAYTALALIFAAKGLVRRDDIKSNTLYYLGATMTNVTYSIVVGFLIRIALIVFDVSQVAFLTTPSP